MKYDYKITKYEDVDSLKIELPKEIEIVATFLEDDIQGIPIKWWLQQIDEVLNNIKEYNEFQGNLCAVQVKKEETLLVDLYSNHDPNICKIETTELRDLIEIWGQAQKKCIKITIEKLIFIKTFKLRLFLSVGPIAHAFYFG